MNMQKETSLYETHPYTRSQKCPCKIDESIINKTIEIFSGSHDTASFIAELERQRIKGKKIWFDEEQGIIFILKPHACESGGGCLENDSLIGRACHCVHYNHSKEFIPKHYCQCSAEYFRPMFEPVLGESIELFPYKTVLSGDDECVIAISIKGKI